MLAKKMVYLAICYVLLCLNGVAFGQKAGSVTFSSYEDISESDLGNSTSTPVAAGPRILVNGSEVQPSTIGAFFAEQIEQGKKDTPELRSAVREELIRRELLVQEAKKKGIDNRPNIKGQIKIAEQATLNRGLLLQIGRSFRSSPIGVKQQKIQEFASSIRRSASVDVSRQAVNGVVVGQDIFESFLEEELKTPGKADSADLRKVIWEWLYKRESLTQEATRLRIDEDSGVVGMQKLASDAVLIRALLSDYTNGLNISDESLRKEYQSIKNSLGSTEYKPRHILVGTGAEAQSILTRLGNGERFEDLAVLSKDSGSANKGGELDWSAPSAYVKPFGVALVQLGKGETTKSPVMTSFGYHIIRLDDSRPMVAPPFESVQDKLKQRAKQKAVEGYVKTLREQAKIS